MSKHKADNVYAAIKSLQEGVLADDIDFGQLTPKQAITWMHTLGGAEAAFFTSGHLGASVQAMKLHDLLYKLTGLQT